MSHRLNEPRIYVESGYRNDEWRDVRAYLSNDKVSYHADNAGGAHGKDTNDK